MGVTLKSDNRGSNTSGMQTTVRRKLNIMGNIGGTQWGAKQKIIKTSTKEEHDDT